jgi:hypothetical protein
METRSVDNRDTLALVHHGPFADGYSVVVRTLGGDEWEVSRAGSPEDALDEAAKRLGALATAALVLVAKRAGID